MAGAEPIADPDRVPAGPDEIDRALEAILLSSDEPLPSSLLAQVLKLPEDEVENRISQLAAGYEVDGRGFILNRVAGGWRYQTHPDVAPYVERFVVEGRSARLSAAAMETLAIVAYKQPISRAQIAAIRGVGVDSVMRSLEQRAFICEIGRDTGPGQAVLFGTTEHFLEKLDLDTLDDLPSLSEFVPGQDVVDALDRGLRPEGEELPRGPDDGVVTPLRQPDPASANAAGELDGGEEGLDQIDAAASDPLARLDETTARLDALVDQVKTKLESAEAALAPEEPEESDEAGESDEPVVAEASADGDIDPGA